MAVSSSDPTDDTCAAPLRHGCCRRR